VSDLKKGKHIVKNSAISHNAEFDLCFDEFAFLHTTEAGHVGSCAAGTGGKVLETFALLVTGLVTESRREEIGDLPRTLASRLGQKR